MASFLDMRQDSFKSWTKDSRSRLVEARDEKEGQEVLTSHGMIPARDPEKPVCPPTSCLESPRLRSQGRRKAPRKADRRAGTLEHRWPSWKLGTSKALWIVSLDLGAEVREIDESPRLQSCRSYVRFAVTDSCFPKSRLDEIIAKTRIRNAVTTARNAVEVTGIQAIKPR